MADAEAEADDYGDDFEAADDGGGAEEDQQERYDAEGRRAQAEDEDDDDEDGYGRQDSGYPDGKYAEQEQEEEEGDGDGDGDGEGDEYIVTVTLDQEEDEEEEEEEEEEDGGEDLVNYNNQVVTDNGEEQGDDEEAEQLQEDAEGVVGEEVEEPLDAGSPQVLRAAPGAKSPGGLASPKQRGREQSRGVRGAPSVSPIRPMPVAVRVRSQSPDAKVDGAVDGSDADASAAAAAAAAAEGGAKFKAFNKNAEFVKALQARIVAEREAAAMEEARIIALRERRRKAILERAMKKRGDAGFLKVTAATAAKVQKPTEEEPTKEEVDPEKAAQMRKLFKKQHKLFLKLLHEKNSAKKQEQEEAELKAEQMRAKARAATLGDREIQSRVFSAPPPTEGTTAAAGAEPAEAKPKAAGSGIQAVRARQVSSADMQKLVNRQQQYLQNLVEKRQEEQKRRQEMEEQSQQLQHKIRQAVLERINSSKANVEGGAAEAPAPAPAPPKRTKSSHVAVVESEEHVARRAPGSPVQTTKTKALPASTSANEDVEEQRSENLLQSFKGIVMDEERWRRRQGLEEDQKVFIMTGWYPDIRKALYAMGWKENPDRDSEFFDLKWMLRSGDVDHDKLKAHQIVNHFARASTITTKSGLLHSLRSLSWFDNVDIDTFFPRCYDLSEPGDYCDFVDDYKCVKAEAFLKRVVSKVCVEAAAMGGEDEDLVSSTYFNATEAQRLMRAPYSAAISKVMVNKGVLAAAMNVSKKRSRQFDASWLDSRKATQAPVTAREWAVLRYCDMFATGSPAQRREPVLAAEKAAVEAKRAKAEAKKQRAAMRRQQRRMKRLAAKTNKAAAAAAAETSKQAEEEGEGGSEEEAEDEEADSDAGGGGGGGEGDGDDPEGGAATDSDEEPPPPEEGEERRPEPVRGAVNVQRQRNGMARLYTDPSVAVPSMESIVTPAAPAHNSDGNFEHLTALTIDEWQALVLQVAQLNQSPSCQCSINSDDPRNVWIVKPAGKSRGRGIECFSDIGDILNNRGGGSKEAHWVVQKYIERPLIVWGRKFDIRQWVMVTGWNPLTVWFYDDCYCRFCVTDFNIDNLSNKYIHLANNSIQKHSKKFDNSGIEGNMWHCDQFIQYIEEQTGSKDLWYKSIQAQIKRIVVWSLQSAQDMVENRQHSFEIYGYDFMIDDTFRPWLIEINSSPDFSYSTPVTERLVKQCSPDSIQVTVAYREATANRRPVRRKKKNSEDEEDTCSFGCAAGGHCKPSSKTGWSSMVGSPDITSNVVDGVDTGRWNLIYRAPVTVTRPLSCLAHDFVVKGTPVGAKPRPAGPQPATINFAPPAPPSNAASGGGSGGAPPAKRAIGVAKINL